MKIAAVVGVRPNLVKIAPILAAVREHPGLTALLVHTGQHHDGAMSSSFFDALAIPEPDVNLAVGAAEPVAQTAEIMMRLGPVLAAERPDLVLVVGDATSTLAAALVAVNRGVPVAHVEAGLRSFDRSMPEEINRIVTDAISALCFTTEPSANENLKREGVADERVHHVGNVMIDTLFRFRERAAASDAPERLDLARGGFAVLTLHRPSNVDDDVSLTTVLDAIACVAADVPVVFPVHPRTRRRLAQVLARERRPGLRPIEPAPYLDFVQLMANAACVLTDSGGVQEETTALGVPCLTLRANTERPITVTRGTNRLVGLDAGRVAAAWTQIRQGDWPIGRLPELWDGKAAQRIVKTLAEGASRPL
jgi:UDP-N-acetylglucosamine 2-epimerase (non-hydrolysing)